MATSKSSSSKSRKTSGSGPSNGSAPRTKSAASRSTNGSSRSKAATARTSKARSGSSSGSAKSSRSKSSRSGSAAKSSRAASSRSGAASKPNAAATAQNAASSATDRAGDALGVAKRVATKAKGPAVAIGAAAAGVAGGMLIRGRTRRKKVLGVPLPRSLSKSKLPDIDVKSVAKAVGEASQSFAKTSRTVSKDIEHAGNQAERIGKALS
jgi:hypothetical protein